MTFGFEYHCLAFADINYTGTFARSHQNAVIFGPELAQNRLTVFIRTVFTPHAAC